MIHDVPPNSTVVGNPGHPVRVEGKRPEGPDADWVHLPDPLADAIKGLAGRISALEESAGDAQPAAEVRPLRPLRGPNPAGADVELRTDELILCLDGRVVEIFATRSDFTQRIHVDLFGAEVKPDGDGAKVRIGMIPPGKDELHVGAKRTRLTLDAAGWAEFQRFFAAVKAARALPPQ